MMNKINVDNKKILLTGDTYYLEINNDIEIDIDVKNDKDRKRWSTPASPLMPPRCRVCAGRERTGRRSCGLGWAWHHARRSRSCPAVRCRGRCAPST